MQIADNAYSNVICTTWLWIRATCLWYFISTPYVIHAEFVWNWYEIHALHWNTLFSHIICTLVFLLFNLLASKLNIIGSDNGLALDRHQAIIWTNAGILLIVPLGTNFYKILIEIHTFPLKKKHLKMSSENWRPFCLGLNVLNHRHN